MYRGMLEIQIQETRQVQERLVLTSEYNVMEEDWLSAEGYASSVG